MGQTMSLNHYLFLYELRDLHSAEARFPDGLWRASRAIESVSYQAIVSRLMDQSLMHAVRLEELFKLIRVTPAPGLCAVMDQLVDKADKQIQKGLSSDIQDGLLVQVVEEMTNYLV